MIWQGLALCTKGLTIPLRQTMSMISARPRIIPYFLVIKKILIQKNNENEITEISYGQLECHEEFSASKFPMVDNKIPKLRINDIKSK